MKKVNEEQSYAVEQKYRVECNRGSKYFMNDDKASAYFDYISACGFAVELWLVRHYFDEHGDCVRATQLLLESEKPD